MHASVFAYVQKFDQFIWFWQPNSGLYIDLSSFSNYCSLWYVVQKTHILLHLTYYSEELSYGLCYLLQINKPYLPLASGEYSFATGAIIVVSSSILVPYRFIPFFTDILQDELYWQSRRWLTILFYFTEFLACLDCRFMAIVLGSFHQFCARDGLFHQREFFCLHLNFLSPFTFLMQYYVKIMI